MTVAQDLAAVVDLACLTTDRTRAEQRALLAAATRVDRAINAQAIANPHLPHRRGATPPDCTYSASHDKACVCRGDGHAWEPECGWSRRVELAELTWEADW